MSRKRQTGRKVIVAGSRRGRQVSLVIRHWSFVIRE
jgi:hypothetical protein